MSWAVDLFAGPGGWDMGLRASHGFDPVGVEWDDAACATRKAAGLPTIQADVSEVEPIVGDLLIASPPCQAFSVAGKGWGLLDVDRIIRCLHELGTGHDTRAEHRAACKDKRSLLIVEPMRWALAHDYEWIVLEQVPAALGLWSVYAELLRLLDYSVWVGVLEAERYGVPQTRERAVLMASRWDVVQPPAPTHQRYVYGEGPRTEVTFDGVIEPWISCADALGWDDDIEIHLARGEGMTERHGERPGRSATAPSFALTSKARSWTKERPATTIACDSRLFQPGGHHQPGQQSENSIRLEPWEAGVLQSFPADYPWQGSRSKQFEQIGNAIPPKLAAAVLSALVPASVMEKAA